jgi:hypothetical protein
MRQQASGQTKTQVQVHKPNLGHPHQAFDRDTKKWVLLAALSGCIICASFPRLWPPSLVEAAPFAPVPIPGGTPALDGAYHVFGPAAFDPADAEPATITNLNAAVGLAYVSGMVTQTHIKTGHVVRLPFVDSDMRFMQGVFRGTDGKVHQGAFAFVCQQPIGTA